MTRGNPSVLRATQFQGPGQALMLAFYQMKLCLPRYRFLCMCHKEISKYNMALIALGTGQGNIKVSDLCKN